MAPILGVLFAVLVGLLAIRPYLGYQQQSFQNIKVANTASQFRQVLDAAQAYVQGNCVNTSNCTNMSFSSLQPYLSANVQNNNPYGQSWNIQASQVSNGAAIQVLVYSSGTPVIPAAQASEIAAQTGAEGGFIPYPNQYGSSTPTNTALGAYGHWQLPLTGASANVNTGPGHLVGLLYFNANGLLDSNYLYRVQVPGDPNGTLNTMETNLSMGGNQISNASAVQVVDPTGVNTAVTESDSLGSSVILSAATSGGGTNTATMTTNSSATSLALAGSTPTLSLNGSESNLSVTGTQAALLVGQSTAASATNLQFISTPETAGNACYNGSGAQPTWGAVNSANLYPLGTIAPNADGSGRPLVCASQTEALAVNSSSGSITISSGASSTSALWQLMGASGSFSQSTSEILYPSVINGKVNNASWATVYTNNTNEPLYISSNCSPMSGSSFQNTFLPGGNDQGVSINFYVTPPAGSSGAPAWTLSSTDNIYYASPSTSIVLPPGYSFNYSLYGGSTVVQQSNGVYTTVPLLACKFQFAY